MAAIARRRKPDAPVRVKAKAELSEAVYTDRLVALLQSHPESLREQRLNLIGDALVNFWENIEVTPGGGR